MRGAALYRWPRQGSDRRFGRQQHLYRRARGGVRPFAIPSRDRGGGTEGRAGRAGCGARGSRLCARRKPARGRGQLAHAFRENQRKDSIRTSASGSSASPTPNCRARERARSSAPRSPRYCAGWSQATSTETPPPLTARKSSRGWRRRSRRSSAERIDDRSCDAADRGLGPRFARAGGACRAYRRSKPGATSDAEETARTCARSKICSASRRPATAAAACRCPRTLVSPILTRPSCPRRFADSREFAMRRRSQQGGFQTWLRPEILGRGNIPANRNVVVVANHSSHLDFGLVGYALGADGRRPGGAGGQGLFLQHRRCADLSPRILPRLIPFDRERAQLESLDDALAELAAGKQRTDVPGGHALT